MSRIHCWAALLSSVGTFGLFFTAGTPVAAGELARFAGLQGRLDIAGGTAHIPVMKEAAKRIMRFNPKIRITVAGGGSGVGVQKVGQGLVQIGNTGRPPSEAEIEKFGLVSFPFAIDGVAVIVHPANPIRNLRSSQVRDIFTGRIKKWNTLDGTTAPVRWIHLYTRDEASGTRAVFCKRLLPGTFIPATANVVTSNGQMKTVIGSDRNGIGYMSIGYVDASVRAVALDGIPATQQNAQNGSYKVVRKLYMNTKGKPSKLAGAFIDYILSPEGAEIIKANGYIPIITKPRPLVAQLLSSDYWLAGG